MKNCDLGLENAALGLENAALGLENAALGLENAALGLWPRAAFSRPWSQFFTIRTSQPANNIYIFSPPCNILSIYMCDSIVPGDQCDYLTRAFHNDP